MRGPETLLDRRLWAILPHGTRMCRPNSRCSVRTDYVVVGNIFPPPRALGMATPRTFSTPLLCWRPSRFNIIARLPHARSPCFTHVIDFRSLSDTDITTVADGTFDNLPALQTL